MSEIPAESLRADVWLWRARFFKSRSLAARFVAQGRLRCGAGDAMRRIARPSSVIRSGDVLTFVKNERIICVRVVGLGVRRGPPAEARTLYEILEAADARD